MKLVERIKKGLTMLGTFLLTIPTKVFATFDLEPMYGIREPEPVKNDFTISILNLYRIFIIPAVFFIGIIIYLKKSKSSKKRKIITLLITIGVVAILYLIINNIINNAI